MGVAAVHKLFQEDHTVEEIDDRDNDLDYKHKVWRIEKQLKARYPALYNNLMDTAWAIDEELWENLSGTRVYPEIEYIEYDVRKLGEPGTINRHVDNQSQVTMVVLLAPPADFEGGLNYFEGEEDDDSEDERCVRLGQGDAVFFFGDRCQRWITPVLSGRRTVLQMELSKGYPVCPSVCEGFFGSKF